MNSFYFVRVFIYIENQLFQNEKLLQNFFAL